MLIRALVLASAATLMMAVPVLAQSGTIVVTPEASSDAAAQNPFSERGGTLPAVMRWLQGQDITLTYIGNDGGAKGYLGEAQNGRFQTFYPTPDGEHMMIGILYRSGGVNVTSVQVAQMLGRFRAVAADIEGADLASLPEVPPEALVVEGLETPIIDWFKEQGMKVTPMLENSGGVEGFFVETPAAADGKRGIMQPFYVLPDSRYAVAGMLTRSGGVNVTGLQTAAIQQKYQVATAVAGNNGSEVVPGANPPPVPSSLLVPETPAAQQPPEAVTEVTEAAEPVQPQSDTQAEDLAPEEPAAGLPPAPAPILDQKPVSSSPRAAADAYVTEAIDSAAFLDSVKDTVFFTVGSPGRPALYMVADPQCPFCHQAWSQLRPLVFSGKIQLRVIMIAGLQGSEPLARSILSQPDPSAVWIAGQGSMANVRIDAPPAAGTPEWDKAGNYLQINAAFLGKFDITRTPFLAYVDPQNRTVVSRGVPDSFDNFLAAIE